MTYICVEVWNFSTCRGISDFSTWHAIIKLVIFSNSSRNLQNSIYMIWNPFPKFSWNHIFRVLQACKQICQNLALRSSHFCQKMSILSFMVLNFPFEYVTNFAVFSVTKLIYYFVSLKGKVSKSVEWVIYWIGSTQKKVSNI